MAGSKSISWSITFDQPEDHSSVLCIVRSPKFLKYTKSTQRLGFRFFKPMLVIQKLSLLPRRASQKVCIVDRVRLGFFDKGVCTTEAALREKQLRQGEIDPKQLIFQAER